MWTQFSGTQSELKLGVKSLTFTYICSFQGENEYDFCSLLMTAYNTISALAAAVLMTYIYCHKFIQDMKESVCMWVLVCIGVYVCSDTSIYLLLCALSTVIVSPQASVSEPLFSQRSTKRFPSCAANFQPGPDPHFDQLESICYCKYKFGNL